MGWRRGLIYHALPMGLMGLIYHVLVMGLIYHPLSLTPDPPFPYTNHMILCNHHLWFALWFLNQRIFVVLLACCPYMRIFLS